MSHVCELLMGKINFFVVKLNQNGRLAYLHLFVVKNCSYSMPN
jgi:hypothetical protein